ncbi:MAG: response regulator transcription factor [Phycisphaerae bacterium]|nr:response regulator transcription factor [Phycisphaerae bacterium]NNF44308.1 response regulator transcription factor [Phycisphaerales bacterium]
MRVLIVEDNPKMAGAIETGLVEHGFAVDVCHTGFDGEELAASNPYDVIVLDLMLPDRDGVEVCRNLRRRKVTSSIVMLTALADTEQKVEGLDAGADDYLTKPFEFDELLARIRALLRRGQATESRRLKCADLELDLYSRVATRSDRTCELSNKEFALLEYLMRNENRVLSRAQIGEKVWDMNFESSSNVIDVYISSLRKKVDRGFDQDLIHTIKGAGYRFGVVERTPREV